ncbi:substrate-binding periplasmic protein [Aestuariivirga sp.]|uniref:substrate-binding periplasmic protein n=1 Tax=Aestuariivirga sp. TaxID=2650926 RepID=UPI003BA95677
MRIIAKLLFAAMTLAVTAISVSAADLLDEIKSRGYIRVGMFVAPPESWVDTSTGEWKGIDADFTNAVGKELGVEVDPIPLTHAALAPALNSGRVDVIVGLYHTEERAKVIAYNKTAFWYGVDALVTQKDRNDIKTFEDLKGKTIGVVRGSAQEMEATKLQERFGLADIKKYDTGDTMLMDIKAGRVDAGIWWGFTFDYAVKQNPNYDLQLVDYMPPEYLGADTLPGVYFTFPKEGSASLVEAFDAKLEQMVAAGETKRVLESYGLTSDAYQTGKYAK